MMSHVPFAARRCTILTRARERGRLSTPKPEQGSSTLFRLLHAPKVTDEAIVEEDSSGLVRGDWGATVLFVDQQHWEKQILMFACGRNCVIA